MLPGPFVGPNVLIFKITQFYSTAFMRIELDIFECNFILTSASITCVQSKLFNFSNMTSTVFWYKTFPWITPVATTPLITFVNSATEKWNLTATVWSLLHCYKHNGNEEKLLLYSSYSSIIYHFEEKKINFVHLLSLTFVRSLTIF